MSDSRTANEREDTRAVREVTFVIFFAVKN
jgi:hypothetical protein